MTGEDEWMDPDSPEAIALQEQQAGGSKSSRDVPARLVTLTAASTIPVDRPAWAWDQRIPLAGVTLVPGREGEGKTALVGHLCARWTRGDLPGERMDKPGDVIYIGHEDDRATVLVPRLMAAGADLDRFLFVDMVGGSSFAISCDVPALLDQAVGRDVVAVVVDPLDAHLGVADSHRKAEVQASIARLSELTQRLRCAGIGIAHFNKGESREVLLKVVGSVGLTTSVRSVLAIGPHPERPDAEKVAVLSKANMTDKGQVAAVRFRVEDATVMHPDGGAIHTARVVVLGEEAGIKADSILTTGDSEARSAVDEATEWLAEVLRGAPMQRSAVMKYARDEGIAEATLKRAAQRIGVVSVRDASLAGRPSTWSLPGNGSGGTAHAGVSRTEQGLYQGEQLVSGGTAQTLALEPYPAQQVSSPAWPALVGPCESCQQRTGRTGPTGAWLCSKCNAKVPA